MQAIKHITEEELQGRGDLDSALRKVDLRDGKDLRAAVEARARNKVEKSKSLNEHVLYSHYPSSG